MGSQIDAMELAVTDQGLAVRTLKTSEGSKEEIDAAIGALKTKKEALSKAIEAFLAVQQAEIDTLTKAGDATGQLQTLQDEYDRVKVKLPAAPKPSKSDKKAAKKEGAGGEEAEKKAAAIKVPELGPSPPAHRIHRGCHFRVGSRGLKNGCTGKEEGGQGISGRRGSCQPIFGSCRQNTCHCTG